MANYIVIASLVASDQGAARGDVISIREPGATVTTLEKRTMLSATVDMTEGECEIFKNNLRPKASYSHPIFEGSTIEEYETWDTERQAAVDALERHGIQINMSHVEIVARLAALDNPNTVVEPFVVDKTAVSLK
jgi:hypothetical protein